MSLRFHYFHWVRSSGLHAVHHRRHRPTADDDADDVRIKLEYITDTCVFAYGCVLSSGTARDVTKRDVTAAKPTQKTPDYAPCLPFPISIRVENIHTHTHTHFKCIALAAGHRLAIVNCWPVYSDLVIYKYTWPIRRVNAAHTIATMYGMALLAGVCVCECV